MASRKVKEALKITKEERQEKLDEIHEQIVHLEKVYKSLDTKRKNVSKAIKEANDYLRCLLTDADNSPFEGFESKSSEIKKLRSTIEEAKNEEKEIKSEMATVKRTRNALIQEYRKVDRTPTKFK